MVRLAVSTHFPIPAVWGPLVSNSSKTLVSSELVWPIIPTLITRYWFLKYSPSPAPPPPPPRPHTLYFSLCSLRNWQKYLFYRQWSEDWVRLRKGLWVLGRCLNIVLRGECGKIQHSPFFLEFLKIGLFVLRPFLDTDLSPQSWWHLRWSPPPCGGICSLYPQSDFGFRILRCRTELVSFKCDL